MTGKIPYFFRQNTDFYYLTGCLEPESILVLWTDDKNQTKSALFMRPKNNHDELWDGPRTGVEHSVDFFGVDEAYALRDLREFVAKYVSHSNSTNIWYESSDEAQPNLSGTLKQIASATQAFQSPTEFLHELRLIKSPAEIDLMRTTCDIASKAVNITMQDSRPGDKIIDFWLSSTRAFIYHFQCTLQVIRNTIFMHVLTSTAEWTMHSFWHIHPVNETLSNHCFNS